MKGKLFLFAFILFMGCINPINDFQSFAISPVQIGSGGYSISIKGILENQDNLTVTVLQTAPTGSAYAVMTQPYCIVKIPVTTKKITFN